MASTSENIVDTLQELTEFVNDRREGYERAVKERIVAILLFA